MNEFRMLHMTFRSSISFLFSAILVIRFRIFAINNRFSMQSHQFSRRLNHIEIMIAEWKRIRNSFNMLIHILIHLSTEVWFIIAIFTTIVVTNAISLIMCSENVRLFQKNDCHVSQNEHYKIYVSPTLPLRKIEMINMRSYNLESWLNQIKHCNNQFNRLSTRHSIQRSRLQIIAMKHLSWIAKSRSHSLRISI